MEVDWSGANAATARERDSSAAKPSDEGAEQADTSAHAADELWVRRIWDVLRRLDEDLCGGGAELCRAGGA